MTQIYFYLPKVYWPEPLPKDAETIPLYSDRRGGIYAWVLQTYLNCRGNQFPCQLVDSIPNSGIIVSHRDCLPSGLKPNSRQLIVCLKVDRSSHPYAQITVVHNLKEVTAASVTIQCFEKDIHLLPGYRYYIPHWPMQGLISRDESREDRFENIAFFGGRENLAPELQSSDWNAFLGQLDLKWYLIGSGNSWRDHSFVDAVVAIRSFNKQKQCDYSWKPALKLFNAWYAGVIPLLGAESAYQYERKSEFDYLEIKTYHELLNTVVRLKDDVDFRRAILANAKIRSQETKIDIIVKRWLEFFENICVPVYQEWCYKSQLQKNIYFRNRWFGMKQHGLQYKALKLFRNLWDISD